MGALKQFNSRHKDIIIEESQEIKTTLTQIPDEFISRVTIAEHDTEIRIDRLVCQQSSAMNAMNDDICRKPHFYPMSFLTRSYAFDSTDMSTSEVALEGIINLIAICSLTF